MTAGGVAGAGESGCGGVVWVVLLVSTLDLGLAGAVAAGYGDGDPSEFVSAVVTSEGREVERVLRLSILLLLVSAIDVSVGAELPEPY